MPNLTAVIGADSSKFVQEVQSADYMLKKFEEDTKNVSDSVKKNVGVTSEQVAAYKKVVSSLQQVASGTMNTKKQQAELTAQIKELKIQWANLSDTAKSGDFGKMIASTLTASQSQLTQLTDQIKQADSELGKFGGQNAKRQLMSLSKELTNLTLQYRQMSDAEKASAGGQELAAKLSDLRKRAGDLKDTVGDVQEEIKVLASDTSNLDAFNQLIGISADALSAYSSILAKVTGDENSLKDAIATVMAVQTTANTLTKVANALQSSSAIMLKTRAIQEGATAIAIKIRTAAEGKGIVATKAATAAQAAFNAVAKMNPYVLLATAIIAAGAALYGFTKYLEKANVEQEKAKQKAEALKQKQEELKQKQDELSTTAAKTRTKYFELQAQWQSLKTTAEKTKWINDNKTAFNSLGFSITDVKTAEDIFVKNTDKVIDALLQRAVAAKQAEQAAERLVELYKKRDEKSVNSGDYYKKVGKSEEISDEEADAAGVRRWTKWRKWKDEEQKKINDYRQKQARIKRDKRQKEINDEIKTEEEGYKKIAKAQLKAEQTLSSMGSSPKTKTTSSKTKTDKPAKVKVEPVLEEGSLAKLEKEISDKQKELKLAVSDESRAKIQADIDTLTGKKNEIELKLKPVVQDKDIKKLQDEINDHQAESKLKSIKPWEKTSAEQQAQDKADNLKTELDFNKQILKSMQDQYDAVQNRISLGATLNSNELQLVNIYDKTKNKIDELSDSFKKAADNAEKMKLNSEFKKKQWEGFKAGVETLGTVNGAIRGIGDEWTNLVENWEDMSPFQQITGGINAVVSTIQGAIQAYEAINNMMELFATISEMSAARRVAANTMESQSEMGKIVVKEGASLANATESGSKLPFPANLAAIAAGVAAVMSVFSMISSFADGGIIQGNKVGDYNIARVNGGEMILNGTQQKRLFNLLNGAGGYVQTPPQKQNVNFVIKGKTLRGVLKNYDSTRNKV